MEFVHNIERSIDELRHSEKYWSSFIENENFEAGTLRLGPKDRDTQSPHKSDEIYFIISGNGYMNIDGKDVPVKKNHSYFVPKNTPHHFHSHTEEILAFYVLN